MNEQTLIKSVLALDFYKISHREQYPEGTEVVYSTWTPRSSKFLYDTPYVVHFGLQYFIKEYLIKAWNKGFFERPKEEVIAEYERFHKHTLLKVPSVEHLEQLHDLGYLPLRIKSAPEGSFIPIRTPSVTIENTDERFYWLTNGIETIFSNINWSPAVSATISALYRVIMEHYADLTSDNLEFVNFQGHDFSMRGMSSEETACLSGAAHLLSFLGTDTCPAIMFLEEYYGANVEKELVGTSIPATEHSVCSAACREGQDHVEEERKLLKRLLTEIYPTGVFSYVSDTYSLWSVLSLISQDDIKSLIMNRDGKLVIRPDSGDPVKILTGYTEKEIFHIKAHESYKNAEEAKYLISRSAGTEKSEWIYLEDQKKIVKIRKGEIIEMSEFERAGVVESLYYIFGGTINSKGYKDLDSHIGAIYGDAITHERCISICERLKDKGFASTNVVYGIGSMSFQLRTRDSLGFAIKSTYCKINGEPFNLSKDPITDDGIKTSQVGKVSVLLSKYGNQILGYEDELGIHNNSKINYIPSGEHEDALSTVFENGELLKEWTLSEIRQKVADGYFNLRYDLKEVFNLKD